MAWDGIFIYTYIGIYMTFLRKILGLGGKEREIGREIGLNYFKFKN